MSGNIRNTAVLLTLLAFMTAGCKHYASFPEIEENGQLVADEKNVSYDDSVPSGPKSIVPIVSQTATSNVAVKKEPSKKLNAKKTEISKAKSDEKVKKTSAITSKKEKTEGAETKKLTDEKVKTSENKVVSEQKQDLTKPDPKVEELPFDDVKFNVPAKTTPSVITDMDLTEMDAMDGRSKVIEPTVETKTILPVKKKIQVVAPKTTTSAEPSVFYLAETIYFNNGGSSVDSKYFAKLRQIVKEVKSHNGKIVVQGFASSRTRNTDIVTHKMANLKVSAARAENVAKILAQYGIPKSRIVTEGLSDSRPAYQEVMPEGERLNRRAEIYISY